MNLKVLGLFGIIIIIVAVVILGGKNSSNTPETHMPVETQSTTTTDVENLSSTPENDSKPKTSTSTSQSIETFVDVGKITSAMSGMTKETRGIVTILNEGNGNIFFTLKDVNGNAKIKAVMFAKTNKDNPERLQMLLNSRDTNSVVYLKGEIDIYKGELEIKVWQVYTK